MLDSIPSEPGLVPELVHVLELLCWPGPELAAPLELVLGPA